MAQWLDEKFIALVSSQLPYFRKQSTHTYTFRCPLCGDSKKQRNKTRGYLFLYRQAYFFKCHNCNESSSFKKFLQQVNPQLFQEYLLDVLRERRPDKIIVEPPKPPPTVRHNRLDLPSIKDLPSSHPARIYVEQTRQLPERAFEHLYFTDEWTQWVQTLGWPYVYEHEDHLPRLIIPWFNEDHLFMGAQVRLLTPDAPAYMRYTTLKADTSVEKIYGMDRVTRNARIYLTEGPLDSWFLPNGISAMGSDLWRAYERNFTTEDIVFIWDNEPRNAEVIEAMRKAIDNDKQIVIWPKSIDVKDLNDMHKAGYDVYELVRNHTYHGARALLELMQWKK